MLASLAELGGMGDGRAARRVYRFGNAEVPSGRTATRTLHAHGNGADTSTQTACDDEQLLEEGEFDLPDRAIR
jgi:hypothetical protein